jgi:hypothetical protein
MVRTEFAFWNIFRVSTLILNANFSQWILNDANDANALNYKHGLLHWINF